MSEPHKNTDTRMRLVYRLVAVGAVGSLAVAGFLASKWFTGYVVLGCQWGEGGNFMNSS